MPNQPDQIEATVKCPNGHEQKIALQADGTITLTRIKCAVCGKEMKMLMHRPVQ